jgi:hypothetical protein
LHSVFGHAEAVVKTVMAAAKGGDMTAARLVLDRIARPCREVPVSLTCRASRLERTRPVYCPSG